MTYGGETILWCDKVGKKKDSVISGNESEEEDFRPKRKSRRLIRRRNVSIC